MKKIKVYEIDPETGGIYPTKEFITLLRRYDRQIPFSKLLEMLKQGWAYSKSGYYKLDKEKKLLHLSTAGWSGNEEIMRAILCNPQMEKYMFLLEYKQGGHYLFRIWRDVK